MHRVFKCQFSNYIFVTSFDLIIQQHNISITFDNRIDTRVHDDAIDNLSSYFFVRINRRNFEILSILLRSTIFAKKMIKIQLIKIDQ